MADISKIIGINGSTYYLKDAQARSDIADIKDAMTGGVHTRGVTTTPLTDGADTPTVIKIGGEDYEVQTGDIVFYSNKEFLWNGFIWVELGDLTALGDLAYKSSATGSYTPAGSVSQPVFTGNEMTSLGSFTPEGSISAPVISVATAGTTTTVNSITAVGTLPTMTMTVSEETLTFGFDAGTLPTKGENVTVKTGDASYSATAPSFVGSQGSVSVTGTPGGTVSKPSFTGTSDTVTVT